MFFFYVNNSTLERNLERAKRKSQLRLKKLESEIEIMVGTHTLQVVTHAVNIEKSLTLTFYYYLAYI